MKNDNSIWGIDMDKKIKKVKKVIDKKMEKLISADKKRDAEDNKMRKELHKKPKKD